MVFNFLHPNLHCSDGVSNPIVREEDIIAGCRMQMRGSLQMKSFSERVIPKLSVDQLVLPDEMRGKINQILDLEKARGASGFLQLLFVCLFVCLLVC